MSLRAGWSPPPVHLNVISGRGGLGDALARIPAFNFVIAQYSHVSMTVYVQDAWLEITRLLAIKSDRIEYRPLSQAPYGLARPIIEFNMERLTTLHLHLTDHAFLILTDALPPSREARAYPKASLVSEKIFENMGMLYLSYIVGNEPYILFTTDYTSPARRWPAPYINQLGRECAKRGFTPVLVGKSGDLDSGLPHDPVRINQNDGIDKGVFYDLRGQTSLVETLGLMQRASAVVGVDNGLIHLAHYTDVPVVVGFTSLASRHRVPVRIHGETIALEAEVPCGGCQSRGFAINTDWRTCLFDDYACTLTMRAERFVEALTKLKVFP